MQTSYSQNMSEAFAGMKVNLGVDFVESSIASEAIDFGLALGAIAGDLYNVRVPKKNIATLTLSTDFITGNSTIVTVDGVSTAAVVYGTSHAATATALLAAINGLSTVKSATKDASGLIYTIITNNTQVVAAAATTLGATQPTWSIAYTCESIFRGIAIHTHKTDGKYNSSDVVNVLKRGPVWVQVSGAVTKDDTAYVDLSAGTGKFTSTSTNNLATGGKFRSTTSGAGLAQLEINLP